MKNKNFVLKTVYVILFLIPFVLGLIFYSKLPDKMITHWNYQNQPDGYSNKIFALFGIPLIIVVVSVICIVGTKSDPKRNNVDKSKKLLNVVIWSLPIITNIVQIVSIMANMGKKVDIGLIIGGLVGVLLIIIGNYLPKCKQNYTLGIKTPWTLSNEIIWNKTHKLGAICFVIAGLIIVIASIVKLHIFGILLMAVILISVFLPIIYSYILFIRQKNK